MATQISSPLSDEERRSLRTAFGAFPTGVTIVTTREPNGTPRGFTANSFTSVSLDPPMLLICIAKSALSVDVFTGAAHFGVSILREDQKAVSGLFASQSPDKFTIADWSNGSSDIPLISGSLATFCCANEQVVDAGDHVVLIGRVEQYDTTEGEPLGYFRGGYFSLGLEASLIDAAAHAKDLSIGAVLQCDRNILLCVGEDNQLSLPKISGPDISENHLEDSLSKVGLKASLEFLYAVFRDQASGAHSIFYHGVVSGTPNKGMTFIPLSEIPLENISNPAERSMLDRYRVEFEHGQFGIYQGTDLSGRVRHITDTTE